MIHQNVLSKQKCVTKQCYQYIIALKTMVNFGSDCNQKCQMRHQNFILKHKQCFTVKFINVN